MTQIVAIFIGLLVLELLYFIVADRYNIIDKPNQRSSHTRIVLRGGGIIFTIALLIWSIIHGFQYPWLLVGVSLAAGISFVDDIRSLPDSLRLFVQFVALLLVFFQIGLFHWEMWWIIPIALIVAIGGTNIFNFMDGINGITGGYSLAILIPLLLLNKEYNFAENSMLLVVALSVFVFCLFNFRTKAKCFAGDVGSIGMAMIVVFCIGRLMMVTGDVTWIILYIIYGADGMLTIFHRIMLHEKLGQAHRKHAYQLMANELKIPHVVVATIYMLLQMAVSLMAIYIIPNTAIAHWIYLVIVAIVLACSYVLFMRRYYHLHEEYLKQLRANSY